MKIPLLTVPRQNDNLCIGSFHMEFGPLLVFIQVHQVPLDVLSRIWPFCPISWRLSISPEARQDHYAIKITNHSNIRGGFRRPSSHHVKSSEDNESSPRRHVGQQSTTQYRSFPLHISHRVIKKTSPVVNITSQKPRGICPFRSVSPSRFPLHCLPRSL
ncbi:hypothetical protein QR680_018553 [Steinernema hermaphroditum]|uniref:Uncharacterized protein n=1 Tax=Steinernema hermaphroditum TaxID=289476 RepID=A0AA39LRA2_9BILA|nr:hypothetical protein QR680_018553 [Steinernema hermaphroditum]